MEGRVRLDPNGPSDSNINGFSITGPNQGSGFAALAGTAVAISQADTPAPGPADIAAVLLLLYATYDALTHETFLTPTILMSTKDAQKSNPDVVAVAGKAVETLSAELEKLKSTPNKTPEIKRQIEKVKKAVKKAREDMKKSEPHGIKGKRK